MGACAHWCAGTVLHTAQQLGLVHSTRIGLLGAEPGKQADRQTTTEKDRKQRSNSAEFDWAAVTNVSRVKSKHSAELPTGIKKNADSHFGLKLGLSGPRFGLAVVIIMDNRRLTTDEKNYIKR